MADTGAMRTHAWLLVLAALLVLGCGCAGGPASTGGAASTSEPGAPAGTGARPATAAAAPSCGWRGSPPRRYDHVVWVVLENHSFGQVVGGPGSPARRRAPYLNALARSCGLATDYHAISHPSLPNYLALVSGRTGGVATSCTPARCPQDRATVFDRVGSWALYAESMPAPCRRSDAGRYVVRHNPPTYFRGLRGACPTHDVPMGTTTGGAFVEDLSAGRLPRLAVVVPNQCHNSHDCSVATSDRWLSRLVPAILASPTYRAGRTALVVTYDEGSGGRPGQGCRRYPGASCHVVTVVVSPTTRPGTRSAARFDHYSLLETTQRMLGAGRLLGHAGDRRTHSMRRAFRL